MSSLTDRYLPAVSSITKRRTKYLYRALSRNDVLSCLVSYDPHCGHHWGNLLPTLITSAIGGLADNQADGGSSSIGQERTNDRHVPNKKPATKSGFLTSD